MQQVPDYVEIMGLNLSVKALYNSYLIYKSLLNFEKAVNYLERYNEEVALIDALQKKRDVVQLTTRYETERKEQQIQLLSQQNQFTSLRLRQTRYFLFALAFMVILLVLLGILLIRQGHIRNEQQTSILQQKLFRAQMNPHFIFNSLSSIQGFIMEKDHIQASIYLSRFAKLVRNILDSSVQEVIPLTKEIQTIEHYLELQKVRYAEGFDYKLNVDACIENTDIMISPMLVQPFVENAIEHGIKHKSTKGMVKVSFLLNQQYVHITIEDDGIGRQKAAEIENEKQKYRLSLSTQIIQERIRSLNRRAHRKFSLEIIDLFTESGEACGTKVMFGIPIATRYIPKPIPIAIGTNIK
jgi:LytS/YehU family sensor histidine kinase